jgi:thiol-disulfide isomerase/thioredoxin
MKAVALVLVFALVCTFAFAACKGGKPAGGKGASKNVAPGAAAENEAPGGGTSEAAVEVPPADGGQAAAPSDGKALLGLKTKDIDGGSFDAAANKGEALTIFNVWATWCSPCVDELPALAKIAKEYEAKGVRVVGIQLDAIDGKGAVDNKAIKEAKKLLAKAKAKFPSIVPSKEIESILNKASAIPMTFLVGPDGELVDTVIGGMDYNSWRAAVDKALKR